jgi:hypothetical protein
MSANGVTLININTLAERSRFFVPTSYRRGGVDRKHTGLQADSTFKK